MPDQDNFQISATTSDPKPGEEAIREQEKREFLTTALERFKLCEESDAEWRKKALQAFEFYIGKQWDEQTKSRRAIRNKPCLTINRAKQFVRMVSNEQRQQRPSIIVNPVGDGADTDTAEILQGIVRHIEIQSDAEIVYDSGFINMGIGGKGYVRLTTDWVEEDDSWAQEIYIRRIKNPFTVFTDPAAEEPDESDALYKFIIKDVPRTEFKMLYPKAEAGRQESFGAMGINASGWATKESVRVAEYFYVTQTVKKLAKMSDGSVKDYESLPKDEQGSLLTISDSGDPLPSVEDTRDKIVKRVKWAKITAVDILEETDWPAPWIPVVPILGDDIDINGKRDVTGIVSDMIDPQKVYNFMVSAQVETIMLAPKQQWVAAEGQTEGHEKEYEQAALGDVAVVHYKPRTVDGVLVGPPERSTVEPPIQAVTLAVRQADNDLKATTGIYDASLGQRGPDESGRAILARQKQSDVANINFIDNLSRTLRHIGKQLVYIIPFVYDAPKVQRIIRPDGSVDHVGLYNSKNQPAGVSPESIMQSLNADPSIQKLQLSIKKIFDIGVGKYDVRVDVGPSYHSKRQEAVQSIMALVQSYPQIMQICGDLLIRNMDWPGAKEIADRLKKMLPPQLQDDSSQDPETSLMMAQSQLQALAAQHQQLVTALNAANQTILQKRLETESKERIALFQAQAGIIEAQLKAHSDAAQATLESTLSAIHNRLEVLHENMSIDAEAAANTMGLGSPAQANNPAGPSAPIMPPPPAASGSVGLPAQ